MDARPIAVEDLESRRLFAVSATILADLDQVALDRQQLMADAINGHAQLVADHRAIAIDLATAGRGNPALFTQLHNDVAGFADKIRADHANLVAALVADRATIRVDIIEIHA